MSEGRKESTWRERVQNSNARRSLFGWSTTRRESAQSGTGETTFRLRLAEPGRKEPAVTPEETESLASPFYRPKSSALDGIRVFGRTEKEKPANTRRRPAAGRWPLGWKLALFAVLVAVTAWAKVRITEALQNVAGLRLAHVKVTGTHYLDEKEVLRAAALPAGENMYKLDLKEARARVAGLGWVDRVYLERRLPRTLVIAVREQRPAALLDSFHLYGVTPEGRVLPASEALLEEDLPLISGVDVYVDAVGTTLLARRLREGLDFLAFLGKKDTSLAKDVSEVSLAEQGTLKVTFLDGVEARFAPGVSELDLKRMAVVLSDLGTKGRRAASMDFRYRDTVIVRTRN